MKKRDFITNPLFNLLRPLSAFYAFIKHVNNVNSYRSALKNGIINVGDYTYGIPIIRRCKGDNSKISIGKFCSISPNVKIFTGCNHNSEWVSTFPFRARLNLEGAFEDGQPSSNGDIKIGNDVWIGEDAIILSGVEIGDGAVIGAGSVVTSLLPPYSICGGVPAKVFKFRFEKAVITKLLSIKWWNWDTQKIIENVDKLSSPNVSEFIEKELISKF